MLSEGLNKKKKKKQQLSGDPARARSAKQRKSKRTNAIRTKNEQTTTHTHTKGYLEESQQLSPTVCLAGPCLKLLERGLGGVTCGPEQPRR